MLGKGGLGGVDGFRQLVGERFVPSVGAGGRQDGVQEAGHLLGRFQVDLRPEPDRVDDPLSGLSQQPGCGVQPLHDALEPIAQRGEVAGEERKERLADVLRATR